MLVDVLPLDRATLAVSLDFSVHAMLSWSASGPSLKFSIQM